MTRDSGPLQGVRVLELGGIGPGPFAGMMLADLGADVIRVDRIAGPSRIDQDSHRVLHRGRRSIAVDLKHERGRLVVLALAERCDALIDGFRPGVTERLGVGPDDVMASNPRLVYGRITGWGQDGPLAQTAGHDINYIAVSGALEPIAAVDGTPTPPLNMLGDFGGGGMLMALGVLAGVLHARETGVGQTIDAAILDGTALLTAMLHSMRGSGQWSQSRGENLFDGGAPYYGVYRTADDGWLALGAIEPQFYSQLLTGLGLDVELAPVAQDDARSWPHLRARFTSRIAEKSRDHWRRVFEGTDACVSVVLSPDEAADHPHVAARATYVRRDGLLEPAPAPRFGTTPAVLPLPAPPAGAHSRALLRELGFGPDEVDALLADAVVHQA